MNYYDLYDESGQDYQRGEQHYSKFTMRVPELWEMLRDAHEYAELAEHYRASAKRLSVKIQDGQFKTPDSVEDAQNGVGFYHRRAAEFEGYSEEKTCDAARMAAAIAISRLGKP